MNSSDTVVFRNGYDLPIYGLNDGSFNTIHIVAMSCLSVTLLCIFLTILASFKIKRWKDFFTKWQKRDRFVIYMALCDGVTGVCHLADHINVFIVRDHIYPKGLCVFYAFAITTGMMAQHILVISISINAFARMFFGHNLDFGKYDWRLNVLIFGVPFVCSVVATVADTFGPTGAFCSFDGVNGPTFQFYLQTLPIIIILPINIVLYATICIKLYIQIKTVKQSIGHVSAGMRATFKVVKSMALFVTAYIIQWWALAFIGFWASINTFVPQILVQFTVFFTNIGGLLNLVVFVMIHRRFGRTQLDTGTATVNVAPINS